MIALATETSSTIDTFFGNIGGETLEQPETVPITIEDMTHVQGDTVEQDMMDDNVVYGPEDLMKQDVLEEDEAIWICANYKQIRGAIHRQTLNRGFFPTRAHWLQR